MERGRKRSEGKKRIKMKLIEDENARMVSFSKRRIGIFKKASDLSTLCGVKMAILLTSMSGKVYSFGSPSVDVIMDPYVNQSHHVVPNCVDEFYRQARMNYLYQQINEVDRKLDEEKSRRITLLGQEGDGDFKSYFEKLDQVGAKKLKKFMLELKKEVALRKRELAVASEASSSRSEKEVTINSTKYDAAGSPIPENWLKL